MRKHRQGKRGGCSCGVGPKAKGNVRCPIRWSNVIKEYYRESTRAYMEALAEYHEDMRRIWAGLDRTTGA